MTIFNSDDDMESIHTSVKQIMDTITDIKMVEFKKKGHFCLSDLGGEEFVELLNEVV